MSERNIASTNSESEALAPFHSTEITQRFHGSSTPRPDHTYRPFAPPSDISSVTSHSGSSCSTPRRHGRSERSEGQALPENRPSSSTPYQKRTSRLRSTSNPPPAKQRNLENIVSERLTLPLARKSLASVFSTLNISTQQSDHSSNSTGNIEPPTKKQKTIHKGQEWLEFKPKRKGRIYEHILNQPNDTLTEAKMWVELYKKQAPQAIIVLIQFFVDVCGYQDFDVRSIFNYEEENYIELRDFMVENPPKCQKKTGKYLMKASSHWSKQSHNAIYAFVKDLLKITNSTEILFDSVMLKHLLGAVMMLICSRNRSMHHTGIVIVVKMNTIFLDIHDHIKKKLERHGSDSSIEEEQLHVLENYETLLCAVVEKLQSVIEGHCFTQDSALDGMKVSVIEEMFNWFVITPSLLSSTKYVRRLMGLIEDKSKKVRLAALVLGHKLIKSDKMDDYMNPFIEKFVAVIIGRVYDFDYGIAAYAVCICTDMLCKYSSAMPILARDRIMMLVYCQNQQLAIAVGGFLKEIFHSYCDEDGEQNSATFIKQLIAFSYLETEKYVPLLVEAVLPHCPELYDWNTMIDLLLEGNLDSKDETKLIDLMSNAAQQTITGKSKINRSRLSQGHLKIQNVKKTSDVFIAKLYHLLKKYSMDPKNARMLTEILLVIDYKDGTFSKYAIEVTNIVKVLQAVFVKNGRKELLETISMVLAKLCEELSVFKNRVASLVEILNQAVINTVVNSFEHLNQTDNTSKDDLGKTESSALKLLVLFRNHDLTELIGHDVFDWLNLEHIVTPKTMKSIITCGYWCVIWMLRNRIANGSNISRQSINELKFTCDEYIKACFKFMKDSEDFLICSEAFECICNINVMFRQDLRNPIKSNPLLEELLCDVSGNRLTILLSFAHKLLFEDKNRSTLKARRISLGNILNMAFLGGIPYQELSKVYKYYYLHNDEYGDIFNGGMQHVRETGAVTVAGVVLHTLTHCFTDTDLTQTKARNNLRALAKQFQVFVSRSVEEVNLILHMGITYAIFSEDRYTFLYHLKYFIANISANDRKLILDFFISRISNQNRDHQVFTDFMGYLKNGQITELPGKVRQKMLTNVTSDTSGSEEEDIQFDSESDSSSFVENYTIDDASDTA